MQTKAILFGTFLFLAIDLSVQIKCNICLGKLGGACANGENTEMVSFDYDLFDLPVLTANFPIQLDVLQNRSLTANKTEITCFQGYFQDDKLSFAVRAFAISVKDESICDKLEEGVLQNCLECTTDLCNNKPILDM